MNYSEAIAPDLTAVDHDTRVLQLGYVSIGVSDTAAWQDFAEKVVGFAPNGKASDGSLYYRVDGQHHRVRLVPGDEEGLLSVGWEVRDEPTLDAIAKRLTAAGLSIHRGSADECDLRRVLGFIRTEDPDGLAVEIYHGVYRDRSPFVSPRGVQFVADDQGLGHIVLRTVDPDVTVAFYRDMLGIRISDYLIRMRAGKRHVVTFMHANRRHHSIALTTGLGPDKSAANRLSHLMVQYTSLDAVGHALDEVLARGLTSNLIGKHTNDDMISFYAQSPSGFNVECGANAVSIDPENWVVRQYSKATIWGHGEITKRSVAGSPDHEG